MQMDSRARYKEMSKYPAVQLDISILIPKKSFSADYMTTIQKTDQKLITGVDLIDEYQGDKVKENERALTYAVTYQASDRTLTDDEVANVHKQVLERLKQTGAVIR
jgi:phenylalanyl-tRNA synthetase beta chain